MERSQVRGSDVLQTWGLITFKEYLHSIPIQWTVRCAMPISIFKGWGKIQADFLLMACTVWTAERHTSLLCHCQCAFLLPRRKSLLREEGRIMAKATGHCTDCLVVKTASSGFVRGKVRGRTWHQIHGSSLPCSPWSILQEIGGFFCQTMTSSLWEKRPE